VWKTLALLLSILAAATASCIAQTRPTYDPFTLAAEAENALNLAHTQQTATASSAISRKQTEVAHIVQTQLFQSNMATATVQAWQFELTRTAALLQVTQTAQAARIQATQTALALAQTQTAATQVAVAQATRQAHEGQTAAMALERQRLELARLQSTNALKAYIGWGLLLVTFGIGIWLVVRATPWVLVKFFGTQHWNGKPIITVPDGKGGVVLGDIARSLGPGLVIDVRSLDVQSKGIFENSALQNQVVARAQAAELLLATGNHRGLSRTQQEHILRKAITTSTDAAIAPYRILQPDDTPPHMLAQPETLPILEAKWRDTEDD
jgi:hypothetical protein